MIEEGTTVDYIVSRNKRLSVEVYVWSVTPSKKYAYVGNKHLQEEQFRVTVDKLREIQVTLHQ